MSAIHPPTQRRTDWIRPDRLTPGWIALALAALAISLFARLSFVRQAFDPDGALFIYMGKLVSEGGRFGFDLVDNKPPTLGLLLSPLWQCLGASWAAYVALQAGLAVLSALALARAASYVRPGSFNPALVGSLVLLSIHPFVFGGFQVETIQTFFASLGAMAACAWLRSGRALDALVVGLCAGTAAMVKPTGLSVLGAFLCTCAFVPGGFRSVGFGLLGAVIPAGVCVIYLDAADAVSYWGEQMREASNYAASSRFDGFALTKLAVVATLAALVVVPAWALSRSQQAAADPGETPAVVRVGIRFVIIWMVLEAVGVVLQRRMYAYHFFPILAPVAMLSVLIPVAVSVRASAVSLLLPAVVSLQSALTLWSQPAPRFELARFIASHAEPHDRVWMDGYARLILETGLRPGSRVPLTFLFTNSDDAPTRYGQMLLNDLQTTRARFVILPRDPGRYVTLHTVANRELASFDARRTAYVKAWDDIRTYIAGAYRPRETVGAMVVYERLPSEVVDVR